MSTRYEHSNAGPLPLETAARARLGRSGYPLRTVRCEVLEGRVVLDGWVATYYLKQVAQSLVLGIPGVDVLTNRIEVQAARTTHILSPLEQ